MKKRNFRAFSTQNIEEKLSSDPKAGLTPESVEAHRKEYGTNRTLSVRDPFRGGAWFSLLSDPLWVLLLSSIALAIAFGEYPMGLALLAVFILYGLVTAGAMFARHRVLNGIHARKTAHVTVIRGGKSVRVAADELVPGDLLTFAPGDMIPADLKLVEGTEDLVLETVVFEEGRPSMVRFTPRVVRAVSTVANEQNEIPADGEVPKVSDAVPAFSRVCVGCGRGYVVALDPENDPGPTDPSGIADALQDDTFEREQKTVSLVQTVLILPLTVLGLLLGHRTGSVLPVFLTPIVLAAVTVPAYVLPLIRFSGTVTFKRLEKQDKPGTDVLVRDMRSLERLGRTRYVVLCGRAALTDGYSHLLRIVAPGQVYKAGTGQMPAEGPLTEALFLLHEALSRTDPKTTDGRNDSLVRELGAWVGWSGFDRTSMLVRLSETDVLEPIGPEEGLTVRALLNDGEVRVRLGNDLSALRFCTAYRGPENNAVLPMTEGLRQSCRTQVASYVEKGCSVRPLIRITREAYILEGYLILREGMPKDMPELVREFRNKGVHIAAFLPDASPENLYVLQYCGLLSDPSRIVTPDTLSKNGKELPEICDSANAFIGFDRRQIAGLLTFLRRRKLSPVIVTHETDDLPLGDVAALQIACGDPDGNVYRASGFGPDPEVHTGRTSSADCSAAMRDRAGILVRRFSSAGGGLPGIFRAYLGAEGYRYRLAAMMTYLLVATVCRSMMYFLSVITGIGNFPPVLTLWLALLSDTAFLLFVGFGKPGAFRRVRDQSDGETAARGLSAAFSSAVLYFLSFIPQWTRQVSGTGSLLSYRFFAVMLLCWSAGILILADGRRRHMPTLPQILVVLLSFGLAVLPLFIPAFSGYLGLSMPGTLGWFLLIPAVGLYPAFLPLCRRLISLFFKEEE